MFVENVQRRPILSCILLLLLSSAQFARGFQSIVAPTRSPPTAARRHQVGGSPLALFSTSQELSLVLEPPDDKRSLPQDQHTAVILLPGCLLQPHQYQAMAEQIQNDSEQAVWVGVPKLFLDSANPISLPSSVKSTLRSLHEAGYQGEKAFVGGHSLGGIFLPSIFGGNGLDENQVAGLIHLGCFLNREKGQKRESDHAVFKVPRLTISGDLDGLVRTSRIAEDFHRHVISEGDTEQARLQHASVLVKGMNHFGFVQGKAPFMESLRDLEPEISHLESVQAVGSTIAEFVDTHQQPETAATQKQSLLEKIESTQQYIEPLLEAMELEGSYHINTPCHKCDDENDENDTCDIDCVEGSPWAAKVQEELVATELRAASASLREVKDEFHESWWINPFADPPFYHPKVEADPETRSIDIQTVSEAVYEKTDHVFDAGFFSNTAKEIRSKFNSPQAIQSALGNRDAPFEPVKNACSKMNAKTIQWALDRAPDIVKKRYMERGIKLQAGEDIEHKSGPAWIWSYLDFRKDKCEDEECRIVDSHTMTTPLDHPVPFAGGKQYCKLLSPAKALDWMYTDALRTAVASAA